MFIKKTQMERNLFTSLKDNGLHFLRGPLLQLPPALKPAKPPKDEYSPLKPDQAFVKIVMITTARNVFIFRLPVPPEAV